MNSFPDPLENLHETKVDLPHVHIDADDLHHHLVAKPVRLLCVLAAQQVRTIVVAHTARMDGRVVVRFGGKVILIDTGMQPANVAAGRASALEIQHGTITAVYTDRKDVLTEK